jgi:hypothetical protein
LLLSNGSTLPSVEDRQRQPNGAVISGMIRITGIDDHDQTESVIRIDRNAQSERRKSVQKVSATLS